MLLQSSVIDFQCKLKKKEKKVRQFTITPAAGKQLIARALALHPAVNSVLESGTMVIVAGTTNGYVAEEILKKTGQSQNFLRRRFFPVPGEIFCELDAVTLLTGASAELVAGGGVCGAEGSVRIAVSGNSVQEISAVKLIEEISTEPQFTLI